MPPMKKLFLKLLQYSQENACVGVPFLIKCRPTEPHAKFLRTAILKNICKRLFQRFPK